MLRTVLLGVLSVTSVVGCKSEGGTSAKTQPGVAAGKVVEVKGAVTVKHGDTSRPLAAGESIEGDDVVTTGADGNVVIELSHNLVRWELGPNKTQKVRESIAFKAAKNTGPTANVEQDTAAAGRPAERSAVGTTVTAVEEPAADSPAPAAAAPAAPAAAEESGPGGGAPAPAPVERTRTRTTRRASKVKDSMPELPSAEAAMMAPSDEAPPARTVRTTRGATRGAPVTLPPPPPAAQPENARASGGAAAPVSGGRGTANPASPAMLVSQKRSALEACIEGHADPVSLLVTISGGKASVKVTSKTAVSAALEACVKKVIGTIAFSGDGKVSTSIKP